MTCPKCQGALHTVDRQGVRLEQCQNCRGIFLDHGELEQILSAEQRYYGQAPPYAPPHGSHRPDSPAHYEHGAHPSGGYGHYPDSPGHYGHRGHHGHRRRSFLEDLLFG